MSKGIDTLANEQVETYLSFFESLREHRKGLEPYWLRKTREEAIERFTELGFPTTHLEAWKYTHLGALSTAEFAPAPAGESVELSHWAFHDVPGPQLVFVNGRFSPEHSQTAALAPGVKFGSMAAALPEGSVEEHLARVAPFHNAPFVALNTALFEDGAFIEIPAGAVLDSPLRVLYLTTVLGKPAMTHPRNLILVGRECQATIVESYLGPDSGVYFTNPVTEIVAGENSHIEYVKVQQEGPQAFHLATVAVRQARASSLASFSMALGGELSREDFSVVLDGEGADAVLNGLYVETGRQHVDNYTTLDHAKPHASSRELYKGVLDDHSSGVFHGRIIVRPDAQKTDAKQSNKNLLLSEDAVINTKPQLEIYADDVKCTHGATVGQVDAEAMFYLRSRGIGLEHARSVLTLAFANEILDRIKEKDLSDRLRAAVAGRLRRSTGPAGNQANG